jgi:endogenous inhibitor of DNA gyrase (YacG/DUF329 family)
VSSGAPVDFDALVAEARRVRRCAECGVDLHHELVPRSAFCSDRCRYRFRDRRRYVENPEGERERSRRYYAEHREAVLGRAAAKRGPRPTLDLECSECGGPLEGRQRVVCGRRCKDARFRRLHPEEYEAKEKRKAARRRERRGGRP